MSSDWVDGYRRPSIVRGWDAGMFRVVLASVAAANSPREIWRDAMVRARAPERVGRLFGLRRLERLDRGDAQRAQDEEELDGRAQVDVGHDPRASRGVGHVFGGGRRRLLRVVSLFVGVYPGFAVRGCLAWSRCSTA